jgi:hypothetical protein
MDLVGEFLRDAQADRRPEPVRQEPLRLFRPIPGRVTQVVEDIGVDDDIKAFVLGGAESPQQAGVGVGHPEVGEFAAVFAPTCLLVYRHETELRPSGPRREITATPQPDSEHVPGRLPQCLDQ